RLRLVYSGRGPAQEAPALTRCPTRRRPSLRRRWSTRRSTAEVPGLAGSRARYGRILGVAPQVGHPVDPTAPRSAPVGAHPLRRRIENLRLVVDDGGAGHGGIFPGPTLRGRGRPVPGSLWLRQPDRRSRRPRVL